MYTPTYVADSCRAAYQLNWSLALFWKHDAPPAEQWLGRLRVATEPDGVRILEHRSSKTNVSQLLLSTTPFVSPSSTVRSVKGRLQYLVRSSWPKAFRRNFSISSVGSPNSVAMDKYIASQVDHHKMVDPRVEARLRQFQYHDPRVDLDQPRKNSYGLFTYNLHVVIKNHDQLADITERWLRTNHAKIPAIARAKAHLLSRVGTASNHLHLTLGANVTESPGEIVLAYMNNLAFAHGSKRVFHNGFYVGTFGAYDLQAIRHNLETGRERRRF